MIAASSYVAKLQPSTVIKPGLQLHVVNYGTNVLNSKVGITTTVLVASFPKLVVTFEQGDPFHFAQIAVFGRRIKSSPKLGSRNTPNIATISKK